MNHTSDIKLKLH